jgi:hypothetical protein
MQIDATFPGPRLAQEARRTLIESGVAPEDIALAVGAPSFAQDTAREARVIWRIVVMIVLWSVIGTAVGAGLGALLAVTIGPSGTSGLIIQMVSWAIFAHLIIGMWAGYLLLADRTERDIGRARPVILTIDCDMIDATEMTEQLRELGAGDIETRSAAPTP